MNSLSILRVGALLGLGATATGQVFPTIPYTRTFDLFVADSFNSATLGEQENIYRLSDLNQDGDYLDAGEVLDFYADTATDLLNTPTGICCAVDGTVYVCDSSTDVILALRDANGDGDANDPGEAVVWFDSATNGSGIALGAAQGMAQDALGRFFVLTANQGTTLVGVDGIVKLEDLNADGDANDAGEASYYFQVPNGTGALGDSNPTEFAIAPDGSIYYGDIAGPATSPVVKGIYRIYDANANGVIDPGESSLTPWWIPTFVNAAWYGFAIDLVGNLYACNHGSSSRRIDRAFGDLDLSGSIDPAEQQQVYATAASATWWDLARRDDGAFLLLDGIPDAITALVDLTADGDFSDPGEVTTVFDKNLVGLPNIDLRAMAFQRAPRLAMTPAIVQIGQSTTFNLRTTKPFELAVTAAALSFIPPFSLAPWGLLEIDPITAIIFGVGISDAAGNYAYTLALANDPSLIGAYGCQGLSGDGYRLFFSNSEQLTITP